MESMDKREQIIELIKEDSWYNIPVENTTDKIFSILCVSNRRELLLAFAEYWNKCNNSLIEETNIDEFLKSK